MSKSKEFMEQFNTYKEMYVKNAGKNGIDENFKYLNGKEVIGKMMKSYLGAVIEKIGVGGLCEKLEGEFKSKDSLFAKEIVDTIRRFYKSDSDSKARIAIEAVVNNHKNDETPIAIYESLKPVLFSENPFPGSEKLLSRITSNLMVLFNKVENAMPIYDKVIPLVPVTEDLNIDVKDCLTDYMKGVSHPYKEKLEDLKKGETDVELIAALDGTNEILTDISDSNKVSNMAEAMGKASDARFEEGYGAYAKTIGTRFSADELNVMTEYSTLMKYYHRNNIGEYTPSQALKTTWLEMIQYARENHLIASTKEEANKSSLLDDAIINDSKKLEEAVLKKDKENIKKYYSIAKDKIEKLDYVIGKLKTIDPNHIFLNNMSSARVDFNPARYRLDIEGSTLFNMLSKVSDACLKYDVEPSEVVLNPGAAFSKLLSNMTKRNSPLKVLFQQENPFQAMSDEFALDEAFAKMYREVTLQNRFNMTVLINSENKSESYHKAVNEVECRRVAFNLNFEQIKAAVRPNAQRYTEIIPTMIMAGKDFDLFTMVNGKEPMIDVDTLKQREPFNLKEYIKKSYMSIPRILDKLEQAANQMKSYKNTNLYNNYRTSLNCLGTIIEEVLVEKYHMEPNDAKLLVDNKKGDHSMTMTMVEVMNAKIQFAEASVLGYRGIALKQEITAIATLSHDYGKKGFFAKIFNSDVRKMDDAIDELKGKLISSGIPKNTLKTVLRSIKNDTSGNPDKYIDDLNKKLGIEPKDLVKTQVEVDAPELVNNVKDDTMIDAKMIVDNQKKTEIQADVFEEEKSILQ